LLPVGTVVVSLGAIIQPKPSLASPGSTPRIVNEVISSMLQQFLIREKPMMQLNLILLDANR